MTTAQCILDAVTLRRVFAALLIGGFAKEILAFISWLTATGRGLAGVPSVRACLVAALAFALNAGLIYLALRGLGSVLERRRGKRVPLDVEGSSGEAHYSPGVSEESAAAAGWPQEEGGNGHGPDRY